MTESKILHTVSPLMSGITQKCARRSVRFFCENKRQRQRSSERNAIRGMRGRFCGNSSSDRRVPPHLASSYGEHLSRFELSTIVGHFHDFEGFFYFILLWQFFLQNSLISSIQVMFEKKIITIKIQHWRSRNYFTKKSIQPNCILKKICCSQNSCSVMKK